MGGFVGRAYDLGGNVICLRGRGAHIGHSFGGGRSGPWRRFDCLPASSFLNRCGDIPREPVSTAISLSAVLFNTGLFASVGAAATFGGTLVTAALLTGVQFALGKTKPELDGGFGPAGINTPEARGSIRNSAAAQRKIYGRMLVGGAWGFYDDTTAPYQVLQLWLARGRIGAIRSVIINKKRVIFGGGTPFGSILDPDIYEGGDYRGALQACFRQGLPDQAIDPLLNTYFPPSGATPSEIVFDSTGKNVVNLPTTYRQRGVATASFRANFGSTREIFEARWGQVAFINPLMEIDGAPLYDPRDPTQDPDDEDTWKFTRDGRDVGRTAALVQADFQRQSYGGRQSSSKIRWDEVAASADYDEGTVHDKDGNPRARHLIDGLVQLSENPRNVSEAMLTANRNFIVQSRGRVGWVSSIGKDPIVTITEKDILGGIEFRMGVPKKDTFNRIRTRFTPPEKEYKEDDGPILDRQDLRDDEDGGELLDTAVRTPFTGDHRAVQWLSAQFLEESRLPKSLELGEINALPKFMNCKVGDVIRVQHRRYPDVNGIYQIVKDGFSGDFTRLTWSLRQYDKAITQRDRSQDEQDFTVAEAA
jgi:hypothetical protein